MSASRPGALDLVRHYSLDKCVFWVGAGMSIPVLPSGVELTEFVLRTLCGDRFFARVDKVWGDFDTLSTTLPQLGEFSPGRMPRLEAVLQEAHGLRSMGTPGDRFDMLVGFEGWRDVPTTPNHRVLALLAMAGASIVTVNFDAGIERAFTEITGSGVRSIGHEYGVPAVRLGAGRVLHIHGVADSPESLVATVARMRAGMPSALEEWIARRLHSGSLFVFAGYSGLDSFDVNPFFDSLPVHPRSSAVLIEHAAAKPRQVCRTRLSRGQQELLRVFGTSAAIRGETNSALCSIADAIGYRRSTGLCSTVATGASRRAHFDWEGAFRSTAVLEGIKSVRPWAILHLSHALGIYDAQLTRQAYADARGQVSDRRKRQSDRNTGKLRHWTLALAARDSGWLQQETLQYMSAGPSWESLASYINARGWAVLPPRIGLAYSCLRVDRAVAASDGQPVGWDACVSLSMALQTELRGMQSGRPGKPRVTDGGRRRLHRIDEKLQTLTQRRYRGLLYVNQYAWAHRKRALIAAALGEDPNPLLATAARAYADATSLDGLTGVYADMARCGHIASLCHNDSRLHEDALEWARTAAAASEITGRPRHVVKAKRLLNTLERQ
ncbi:MAG: SIR2 family protein [Coriobacteriia bacterium]|nr:SIR2 family protein [Coriobacteriia bacterium]